MNLYDTITPWATKIVGALLILFVGFVLGRLAGIAVKRVLHGVSIDKNVRKAIGHKVSLERTASGLLSILIYAAAIIMMLNYLGLTTVVLTVIITVIVVLLAFSMLLAVKDLLPNAFAGITLKLRGELEEGDKVEVRNVSGRITDMSLLSTSIDAQGDLLVVPNSLFLKEGYTIKRKATTKKKKSKKKK